MATPALTPAQQALVDSFLSGDFGAVEFTELALEADMTMDQIGTVLEEGQDVF